MSEVLCGFIPFLIALSILSALRWRQNQRFDVKYYVLAVLFSVYVILVFHVTGISTAFDLARYGFSLRGWQINLLPFSDENINWRAYYQNVLMFLPFGFFLPLIWQKTGGLLKTTAAGLAFSLLIELSQLFNYRSSDVDDLIMNTIGAAAGYILYKLFAIVSRRKSQHGDYSRLEPVFYIAVIYLSRFLLLKR